MYVRCSSSEIIPYETLMFTSETEILNKAFLADHNARFPITYRLGQNNLHKL